MTKNRRSKRRHRAAAEANGVNYTSALRHASTKPDMNARWRGVPASLDAAYPSRLRTDLPWADLVLDSRRGWEVVVDDLARVLPLGGDWVTAGHPDHPGSGVLEIPAADDGPGSGAVRVSVHLMADRQPYAPASQRPERINGKPGVLLLVTYPDGFRIGYIRAHLANYRADADDVWSRFEALGGTGMEGLSPFVTRADGNPAAASAGPVPPAVLVRQGAAGLRAAVCDLASWLPVRTAPAVIGRDDDPAGCWEIDRMMTASTLGFRDVARIDEWLDRGASVRWLNDARANGFDPASRDDLAWLEAALASRDPGDEGWWSDPWDELHRDGWSGVARVRREGWTLSAAIVLHERVRDLERVRQRNGRADGPRPTWSDSDADRWLRSAGSAAEASRLIESGAALPD